LLHVRGGCHLIDKESTDELFKLVSNIFGENIFIYTHGHKDVSVVSSLIRILQFRLSKTSGFIYDIR
jgi:hypothetical protein